MIKALIKKHRKTIFIVFVALIIAAYAYGSQSVQNCIDKYYQEEVTKTPKERHGALGLQLVCTWSGIESNSNPIIALFTIIVAIFTGLLFLDGRDKNRKELRAYLGIKEQGIRYIGDGRFQAYLVIENSGQTPAREICMFWRCEPRGSVNPGVFPFGELKGKWPLAPGGQRTIRHVLVELVGEDILRIANDREVFVWGRIEYKDIFNVKQSVDFRFNTRETSMESGQIVGWALQPTENGNDAT